MEKVQGYTFIYDQIEKNYDDEITSYNQLQLVARNLFKEISQIKIKYNYVDVDDIIKINNQIGFDQIYQYHVERYHLQRLKVVLEKEDLKFSSILESNFILAESNFLPNNCEIKCENKHPQIKSENSDKNDYYEIKSLIKNILTDMTEKFEKKFNLLINNNIITKEFNFEIISQDPNTFTNNLKCNNSFNSNEKLSLTGDLKKFYCVLCIINSAELVCSICDEFFICLCCYKISQHSNHPFITINYLSHFNKENISMMSFSSLNGFSNSSLSLKADKQIEEMKNLSFVNNRKFFSQKGTPLKIKLEQMNTCYGIKKFEKLMIPIEIINQSNITVDSNELLVTAKNNKFTLIENILVKEKIQKFGKVNVTLEILSYNSVGLDELYIILLHSYKSIDYEAMRLFIEIL